MRISGDKMEKRTHVYVQRPKQFEISGCQECGNEDPDWSEYNGMLWCATCQKDFTPEHEGVFGGPIGVELCELLGIYFDRVNIATNEIEPGPNGVVHFRVA
jgi:hypothetical protein